MFSNNTNFSHNLMEFIMPELLKLKRGKQVAFLLHKEHIQKNFS